MDDIDIEAQQGVPENTDHSRGDHMNNSTDGEFDYYIQDLFVEAIGNRKAELYKAAIIGDWWKAREIFYDGNHISPTTRLNKLGETALHIATAANQTEFVEKLVEWMNVEDLAIKTYGPINNEMRVNQVPKEAAADQGRSAQQATEDAFVSGFYQGEGNTALCYAAASGNVRTARYLVEKNPDLSIIRGQDDILPIQMAARHGHQKMVLYLYDRHAMYCILDESTYIDVLMAFIDCDMFGNATEMLSEKPWLAKKENSKGLTALYAFAQKSRFTSSKFRNCTNFLRYSSNRQQGADLVQRLLELIGKRSSKLIKKALFKAAERGNLEFVTVALDMNPDLAFELDENCYTIFHIALLHRHTDIFNIVHEMDSIQNILRLAKDEEGNNILHLAGKLPLSKLQGVPGEALQLQHELYWFQKVESLVGKHLMEEKNVKGKTPQQLFADEHEELRKKGAEWMKDTINSCMVVATLVAGVAFAAAITIPGGNVDSNGVPILINHFWFKVFAIFNSLSLIFSASSISLFLTVLISDYSLDGFLKSLPTKFTAGLLFLSAAVQAILVAFIAASFVLFEQQNIGFAYYIAAVGLVPVAVFGYGHFRHALRYLYLFFAFRKHQKSLFSRRWASRRAIDLCV